MLPVLGPYSAVDWHFIVRTDGTAEREALSGVLQPLASASRPATLHAYELRVPEPGGAGSLRVDDVELMANPDPGLLYTTLLWHVNRGVEQASTGHVLLHASAAERDGRAIVLAAPSESGKTTLVAGLVEAGLRYLTDECVALSPRDGRITPFPKSLSVDRGSWTVLPELLERVPREALRLSQTQWQVPPRVVSAGAVPAVVVLPRYVPGAATALEATPRSEVLGELMHQRFAAEREPGRDLKVLAATVRRSSCYRLTTGSLADAVPHLLATLIG